MDMAPRDATVVLLWYPDQYEGDYDILAGHWEPGSGKWDKVEQEHRGAWVGPYSDGCPTGLDALTRGEPTHWQPLPAPPETETPSA